jgi:hypothetical protein
LYCNPRNPFFMSPPSPEHYFARRLISTSEFVPTKSA